MKKVKFVAAALFCSALVLTTGCDKNNNDDPLPTPIITPGEETTTPDLENPGEGYVTIAAYITADVCNGVYLEGPFCGWDLTEALNYQLTALDGYTDWYAITMPSNACWVESAAEYQACKIMAAGEDGIIPTDWSSQWAGTVTLLDGIATIGSENNAEPTLVWDAEADNSVIYLQVNEWKLSPCQTKEHYESVTFNLTIPEAVEGGVYLHGPFVDDAWNGVAMTKVNDTQYTYTLAPEGGVDQYTEYQYTLAADNWEVKGLFVVDGECSDANRSIEAAVINDVVTGFAADCDAE